MNLLRCKKGELREKVLEWCARLLYESRGRSKMQIDRMSNGTHGCFVNFGGVMLRLSEPFLDPMNSKLMRLDPDYIMKGRLSFDDETKLALLDEKKARWVDERNDSRIENFRNMRANVATGGDEIAGASTSSPSASKSDSGFHFICECFFMTAQALHLGPLRAISEYMELLKDWQRRQGQLESLEQAAEGNANGAAARQLAQLQAAVSEMEELRFCYETALADPSLLEKVLRFYKMQAVWLLKIANDNGDVSAPQTQYRLPLPQVPHPIFTQIPEFFIDDIAEFIIFVERMPTRTHQLMDALQLEELFTFTISFMGSPTYVNNPYVRAKLVEVLRMWTPVDSRRNGATPFTQLFEMHDLAVNHLSPSLLKLYVDIEFTGSHTQVGLFPTIPRPLYHCITLCV